ncbi:MAG: class I tRNA ligase family protein [Lachnospiraceae bacterium]|nr:class I tRNA ligase family protein [Lachnospiraceae bacterium]
MINKRIRPDERPVFPKRAIITAGMPYGNKKLHFGHVGGMFVHADTFARFLRDRIGEENVVFVSGTDCYGSPIDEAYRKLVAEGFKGTIEDYVMGNHNTQKQTLLDYEIGLNLFGASAFGETGKVHKEVSAWVFETLYKNGWLEKLSTPQFFDTEKGVFLNGRQVVGKCPIEGCQSEHAYADECSLGHQYMPSDLIDPVSTLSGKRPEIRYVSNWYFKLDECRELMHKMVDFLRRETNTRKNQLNTIDEFLKPPYIYVQKKLVDDMDSLRAAFPAHETIDLEEEKKPSVTFVFENLADRDAARKVLDEKGINYRTGKTLVPFRLSGNAAWGVPVPDKEDMKNFTFWVWPESLWAPISFSKTYLMSKGCNEDEWKNWWDSEDAKVYQFIGEDNIYFYGIAEMAMAVALKYKYGEVPEDISGFNFPHLVANCHILFGDKKASSSSEVKPPMAEDLLSLYSPEQLRMHFLSLGLSSKSVGFKPKTLLPELKNEPGMDMVLKEGNLLTNVFNRIVRSCFYTIQEYYGGKLPANEVDPKIIELSKNAILEYERHMYNHDFHRITYTLDSYIREINKHYVNNIRTAEKEGNDELRSQIIADCFYCVKVCATLLHPFAPNGCEKVREYLNVDKRLWSWDHIFEPLTAIMDADHTFKFLEPRVDFFEKPSWQFDEGNN